MTPEEFKVLLVVMSALMMLLPVASAWLLAYSFGRFLSVRSRLIREGLYKGISNLVKEWIPQVHANFWVSVAVAAVLLLCGGFMWLLGNEFVLASVIFIIGVALLAFGLWSHPPRRLEEATS